MRHLVPGSACWPPGWGALEIWFFELLLNSLQVEPIVLLGPETGSNSSLAKLSVTNNSEHQIAVMQKLGLGACPAKVAPTVGQGVNW